MLPPRFYSITSIKRRERCSAKVSRLLIIVNSLRAYRLSLIIVVVVGPGHKSGARQERQAFSPVKTWKREKRTTRLQSRKRRAHNLITRLRFVPQTRKKNISLRQGRWCERTKISEFNLRFSRHVWYVSVCACVWVRVYMTCLNRDSRTRLCARDSRFRFVCLRYSGVTKWKNEALLVLRRSDGPLVK